MKKNKEKKERRENKIWRMLKKGLGVFFLIIGVAGLVLPLIPGILFILIGLALYHNESIGEVIKKAIKKLKKAFIKRRKNPLKLAEL